MKATANTILAVNDLIKIPVGVCKGTESKDVKLDRGAPSGAPLKRIEVDSVTGEAVELSEIQHGLRIGDDFHPIPKEALKQIDEATKLEEMRVTGSMPVEEIPFDRVTGFYYIQSPTKGGTHQAYRLVYEALLEDETALTTKWTARSRQKLAVIYADGSRGCLVMNTLDFASNVRQADDALLAPQASKVEQAQVDLAREVIADMSSGVDALETEVDEAIALKQQLVDDAAAGKAITVEPTSVAATAANADLTALLEASLAK
jgi:DNA end-binding protein Ku